MPDKNNTLAATREALVQTSQIKNISPRSSNATIHGIWEGLKAGPAVEKMAESLGLSYQPWQQEPQQKPPKQQELQPPKQQEPESPKRKHSKHKTHKRWQGDRVDIVLKGLFSGTIPTEAELTNTDLYLKVWGEFNCRKWSHPPSQKTIRRRAGRLKD